MMMKFVLHLLLGRQGKFFISGVSGVGELVRGIAVAL